MGRHYTQLGQTDRARIKALHDDGYNLRKISRTIGISHSTISRELKRNSYRTGPHTPPDKRGTYDPTYATHTAYLRRWQAKYQGKKITTNQPLQAFIVEKLQAHWNPDEIAGYLKCHPELGFYASKTAIYEWLYTGPGQQTNNPEETHKAQSYTGHDP